MTPNRMVDCHAWTDPREPEGTARDCAASMSSTFGRGCTVAGPCHAWKTQVPMPEWVNESELSPSCGRCGKPAQGYAMIDGKRYCHEAAGATCYMKASWEMACELIPPDVTAEARRMEHDEHLRTHDGWDIVEELRAELEGYRNGNRDLHEENQRLRNLVAMYEGRTQS